MDGNKVRVLYIRIFLDEGNKRNIFPENLDNERVEVKSFDLIKVSKIL